MVLQGVFRNLRNPAKTAPEQGSFWHSFSIQKFESLQGSFWHSSIYTLQKLKGTVRRYGSRSIAHDFTGSEIITKAKVYVVLQSYVKKIAKTARVIYAAKLEDHGSRE